MTMGILLPFRFEFGFSFFRLILGMRLGIAFNAPRLADDGAEDAHDARRIERALVGFTQAGQDLALAPAIVNRQPGRILQSAELSGYSGPLVEQSKQLGIEYIDFPPPLLQCLSIVVGWLAHRTSLEAPCAAKPAKSKNRDP